MTLQRRPKMCVVTLCSLVLTWQKASAHVHFRTVWPLSSIVPDFQDIFDERARSLRERATQGQARHGCVCKHVLLKCSL